MKLRLVLAALALVCLALPAGARPRHVDGCSDPVMRPCEPTRAHHLKRPSNRDFSRIPANFDTTPRVQIIGSRPAGCPSRYCGCGASLHIFGRIIPALNLAANWLRFPRAAPAPGMVAARRGHVFVLKQHISGSTWLVHDSNSGGGKTRLHPRSIAGFAIVDPRGQA